MCNLNFNYTWEVTACYSKCHCLFHNKGHTISAHIEDHSAHLQSIVNPSCNQGHLMEVSLTQPMCLAYSSQTDYFSTFKMVGGTGAEF